MNFPFCFFHAITPFTHPTPHKHACTFVSQSIFGFTVFSSRARNFLTTPQRWRGAGFAQKKKKKTTPPLLDRYMLKQARMGVCVKEGGPYCVCRLVTSFFRAADVLLLLLLIYLIGPRAERLRKHQQQPPPPLPFLPTRGAPCGGREGKIACVREPSATINHAKEPRR